MKFAQFTSTTARVYNVAMKQGGGKAAIRKEKNIMAKNYERRENIKNYDGCVVKDRLMNMASELEEMGFKRDARTLYRIVGDIEIWQHK